MSKIDFLSKLENKNIFSNFVFANVFVSKLHMFLQKKMILKSSPNVFIRSWNLNFHKIFKNTHFKGKIHYFGDFVKVQISTAYKNVIRAFQNLIFCRNMCNSDTNTLAKTKFEKIFLFSSFDKKSIFDLSFYYSN